MGKKTIDRAFIFLNVKGNKEKTALHWARCWT